MNGKYRVAIHPVLSPRPPVGCPIINILERFDSLGTIDWANVDDIYH